MDVACGGGSGGCRADADSLGTIVNRIASCTGSRPGRLSAGRRVQKIRQAKRPNSIHVSAGGQLFAARAPPTAFRADWRYGDKAGLLNARNSELTPDPLEFPFRADCRLGEKA